jgi:hypothetical protein
LETVTFLFVENDSFGRFEAGATASVSQTMEIDASFLESTVDMTI